MSSELGKIRCSEGEEIFLSSELSAVNITPEFLDSLSKTLMENYCPVNCLVSCPAKQGNRRMIAIGVLHLVIAQNKDELDKGLENLS